MPNVSTPALRLAQSELGQAFGAFVGEPSPRNSARLADAMHAYSLAWGASMADANASARPYQRHRMYAGQVQVDDVLEQLHTEERVLSVVFPADRPGYVVFEVVNLHSGTRRRLTLDTGTKLEVRRYNP